MDICTWFDKGDLYLEKDYWPGLEVTPYRTDSV